MLPSKAELPECSGAESIPLSVEQPCPNMPENQIEKNSGPGTDETLST